MNACQPPTMTNGQLVAGPWRNPNLRLGGLAWRAHRPRPGRRDSVVVALGAFFECEVLGPESTDLDVEILRLRIGIQNPKVEFGLREQSADRVDVGTVGEPVLDGVPA